jgi:hypothetical protein
MRYTSNNKRSNGRFYLLVSSILFAAGLIVFLLVGQSALAHQRSLFSIGGKDYLFVVGSQNEPVFVDDKSGVDFFAYTPDLKDPLNSFANGSKPIEGLEKMLKVEISAGPKKKVLALEPAFREPGHYEAAFYPTIQTTYNYRIFGNVSGIPVDLTFTCAPGGVAEGNAPDNSTVKISDQVTRKGLAGGFGCPESRSDVSFPEKYESNVDIQNKISQLENRTMTATR